MPPRILTVTQFLNLLFGDEQVVVLVVDEHNRLKGVRMESMGDVLATVVLNGLGNQLGDIEEIQIVAPGEEDE